MKRRVVFAGDSIIHGGPWQYWLPNHYVTNFAFPGHTTEDLDKLIPDIAKSQPELLIVMIGTNDFGKHRYPVDRVIKNVIQNATDLRALLPETPIIWNALSPRSDEFSTSVIEVNSHIKPELERMGIIYFDSYSLLKDPESNIIERKYCEDPETFGLHLNNAGYELWFEALSPYISNNLELVEAN